MKKRTVWLLGFGMLFLFAACNGNQQTTAEELSPLPENIASRNAEQLDLSEEKEEIMAENGEDIENVAKDSTINTLKCTFEAVEFGDYLHFTVRDLNGKELTFYLAKGLPYSQWQEFDLHPKKLKGTPLEVEWRTVDKFLEHAGAVNTIEEITNIKIVE